MLENMVQRTQLSVRIAGKDFMLDATQVQRMLQKVLPEPINDHYAVVDGRRYPPKQVIGLVTGLDRADFTTHQARRVLRRLAFTVGRRSTASTQPRGSEAPQRMWEADLLRPFMGEWVAQRGREILVSASTPEEVLAWLERYDQQADGMFRVPTDQAEAEGGAPD